MPLFFYQFLEEKDKVHLDPTALNNKLYQHLSVNNQTTRWQLRHPVSLLERAADYYPSNGYQ